MKKYADYTNEMLCVAIQAGDDYAKEVLIERNRRWVGKLAESFHKMLGMNVFATSAAVDDLIQAGNMAMLRAAGRYNPNKAPRLPGVCKENRAERHAHRSQTRIRGIAAGPPEIR